MRIVLMRHGETDYNRQGRFQANADIPLNQRGVAQAEAVAARMRPGRWARVYSSKLVRAVATAEAIATRLGVERAEIPELKERDLGHLDGRFSDEHSREHPEDARRLRADLDFAPSGGETRREALARFLGGLRQAAWDVGDLDEGQSVLIVAHGGVIDILAQQLRATWSPGTLLDNCHALSLLLEESSLSEITLGICHFNVWPDECEGLWPHPQKQYVHQFHSYSFSRGVSAV